uniref:Putative ribonuclease H-like domain-containing protein n=1 Tax=Tanacetum cinerariifolium TaxID=118510 RepID=A0A6L2KMJ3_TANCI|nr:putative ribonuclease H-like domain-containing protein [Tanacetum cinerariifolium]
MSVPATAEEKINKKNDVKARSLLLMALPNEHQLTFIWMNKADIETMSIDDLYNNFKIVEQDVKKYVGTSTGAQNIAFMTAPSTSSTNDVNTANPAYKASNVSPNVNTASLQVSTANFSDNAVYAFMVENPNGSNLLQQDLEKIHDDYLKAMDLRGLATIKEQLFTYKKNEVLFREEVIVLKRDVACKDYEINMLKSEFEKVKQEKECIKFKIKKFDNASKSLDKLIGSQIMDNSKKGLGYHAVPPPHPLIYNGPIKLDLSYFGLNEFKEPEFKGYGPRDSKLEFDINHDKKSDDSKESFDDSFVKEQGKPRNDDKRFIDSGCSRHVTGNIDYLLDFKEFDEGYVTFRGGAHGGRISGKAPKDETSMILKNFIKEIENLVDKKVKIIRCDNATEFKNKVMDNFCREKGIKRHNSVARTPLQNGATERRNKTLIETAITMLADSKLPTTFWAKAVSTAFYVQNRVLIVKPHNKTPYELFRCLKPALSFMRPFGCHVTILSTFDNLGKFDGKSDEGFFIGYSLCSKAFRVYNTRTRKVKENLHIRFLENKAMIEGNGPKWLFDIDSLTQSMNYVPVAACTILDESADAYYFDTPSKDVEDGIHNEHDDKDKFKDDSSSKEVNAIGQHANTASLEVNIGRFELNTIDPSLNTASSFDPRSPTDMFKLGASDTLEATHVEFFSDRDTPDVDLGNIPNSYGVLTISHTRIHKDHPIENVIKPTRIAKALSDSSWVEATQEELLQFKLQHVWILVDLPYGKKAIGKKLVFRNKKDKRCIVIRNKERLVA